MSKPIVVLIHGMGNHTAPNKTTGEKGSFGVECVDTLNKALQMYPSFGNKNIESEVSFVEIHYNNIFDIARNEMAQNAKSISDFIKLSGSPISNIPNLVESLIDFESSLGSDKSFYTHWLDVILYKLYFGEFVRTKVAMEIGEILTKNNARDIHIIAHSLGTAVIHDTLHKIYSFGYQDNDDIADLHPTTHKIKSLWQIANVSRLANSILTIEDPYKSIVRPGAGGIVTNMKNIHHEWDPFTWPKKFVRKNDGNWLPTNTYKSKYQDIETKIITQLNTHSITQYLHDPDVHLFLFKTLKLDLPTRTEVSKAKEDYKKLLLTDAEQKLKNKLLDVKVGNQGTLSDYFKAAKGLRAAIKGI